LRIGARDAKSQASPDIESLTRQMVKGDEAAYRAFYESYFDRLWRYLLVVAAGNEDAAREALQSTMVRVARHVKVFREETVFWSWLTVLARTAYLDETRKRRRYFSFLDRFTTHSKTQVENAGDTDDALEGLLKTHLETLTLDERNLIEQKYFARRTVRDIANAMQTTEKTVESKLGRIRAKLRNKIHSELRPRAHLPRTDGSPSPLPSAGGERDGVR
jgi:RNA polymerase sigma-70 factor (ECF subfamily)